MNIEQIRADIFRLFDIKVDKDDPIWAFLYANREVIRNLEDILDLSKSENKEYHKLMRIELEEFKKVAKESVRQSIEQFDFRVTQFSQDIENLKRINNELILFHNRFKNDITNNVTQIFDDKLDKLALLFDSNLIALEYRMKDIIEAVNYDKFAKNIEREVESVVKKSLIEIRGGVSINNKAMERIKELQDQQEHVTKDLKSKVSTLTILSVVQTILFGASLVLFAGIYFANDNLKVIDNENFKIERGTK